MLEVAELTRRLWPTSKPVFCRLSITDWHVDGEKNVQGDWISWGADQSQILVSELDKLGIDLVDCTSGGLDLDQTVRAAHGYNVRMASRMDHKCQTLMNRSLLLTGSLGESYPVSESESHPGIRRPDQDGQGR